MTSECHIPDQNMAVSNVPQTEETNELRNMDESSSTLVNGLSLDDGDSPHPPPAHPNVLVNSFAAVLQRLKPSRHIRQRPFDYHTPTRLDEYDSQVFAYIINAVATLCLHATEEAHALLLCNTTEGYRLVHASNGTQSEEWNDSSSCPGILHLRSLCTMLRDPSIEGSKLLVFAYRWRWPALVTQLRAPTMEKFTTGLHNMLNDDVYLPMGVGFLKQTLAHLAVLRQLPPEAEPNIETIRTVHETLVSIGCLWFTEKRYFGNETTHYLGVDAKSYIYQLTNVAQACSVLMGNITSSQPIFSQIVEFLHLPVLHVPYEADLNHPVLSSFADGSNDGFRAQKDAWSRLIVQPSQALVLRGTTEVHCECTIFEYLESIDRSQVFCYIGLSRDSCFVCDQFFAEHNEIGYRAARSRYFAFLFDEEEEDEEEDEEDEDEDDIDVDVDVNVDIDDDLNVWSSDEDLGGSDDIHDGVDDFDLGGGGDWTRSCSQLLRDSYSDSDSDIDDGPGSLKFYTKYESWLPIRTRTIFDHEPEVLFPWAAPPSASRELVQAVAWSLRRSCQTAWQLASEVDGLPIRKIIWGPHRLAQDDS